MPTKFDVSAPAVVIAAGTVTRLKGIPQPPGQIGERGPDVGGPVRVAVCTAIAKREEFGAEKIEAAQRAQAQSLAVQEVLEAILPPFRQVHDQRGGSIVEPVIAQCLSRVSRCRRKQLGLTGDLCRNCGNENIAIARRAMDDAEQVEGGSANDYDLEAQLALGEVLIEGVNDLCGPHGIYLYDTRGSVAQRHLGFELEIYTEIMPKT